jgi:hypothetical protein
MNCDAKIRPMRPVNDTEITCERDLDQPHENHRGTIRDYAYEGSETILNWAETDRRNFRGDWHPCQFPGCTLPNFHRGAHA